MLYETVAVLMPTYNGSKFIKAQIESIINQKKFPVHLYISDDGSDDDTLIILDDYFKKYPNIFKKLYKVNFKHPVKNYISLTLKVPEYKYYAFADQDDVWFEDKLIHSISKLNEGYLLYGGRVQVTDENLKTIGYSPIFEKPTSFANAIVQNIAGANTMVFNHSAMKIFRKIKNHPITSIDWLFYILVTFYGNKVFYDKHPKILYRQHSNNDHGIGKSFQSRLSRFLFLIKGGNKLFNELNVSLLNEIVDNYEKQNLEILSNYNYLRNNMKYRLSSFKFLKKSKIYRQTFLGNLNLNFSIFFGLE